MSGAAVLIVEDETFARTLIVSTLQAHNIQVVASAATASSAVSLARQNEIDVAVLDLDLGPGPTGFEVAVVLRRELPRLGIVFLTSYQDPRLLIEAWDMVPIGARFVSKPDLTSPSLLLRAVLSAKSKPLAPQPIRLSETDRLTSRQFQVLKMVAEGHSSREIAKTLGVSEKAVEAAISRVHRILETDNRGSGNKRVSLVKAFYTMTGRTPPRV